MSDTDGQDGADWDVPKTPAPSGGDRPEDTSRFSRKLLVAIFTIIFIGIGGLGILAYVLFGSSTDGATDSIASPLADTTTLADDFDRPDDSDRLGTAPTGQPWEAPSGTWGVVDQEAYVSNPNPDEWGRSWAVTDLGSSDGSVSATATTMAKGWGIVFRYRGPFNYWMLQASPEYATYNLVKVVDGELEPIAQNGIGLAPIEDGTKVGVEFEGPMIRILLNDEIAAVFRDTALQSATKVGLIVSAGGADTARWDDFAAQALPETAADRPDGGGG
jgi:hypothetical protein